MHRELRSDQDGSLLDGHATVLVALGRCPRGDPDRGIEAQRLCEDLLGDGELRVVGCSWQPSAEDVAAVGCKPILDAGMAGEQPQGQTGGRAIATCTPFAANLKTGRLMGTDLLVLSESILRWLRRANGEQRIEPCALAKEMGAGASCL
jgi:hypothetical protein